MSSLYRTLGALPTLAIVPALLLAGCGDDEPPAESRAPVSNVYVEALNEAKAAKRAAEGHLEQEHRIDELLGRDQARER
jgi:hypothetical protein